jgi:hypothetical protein
MVQAVPKDLLDNNILPQILNQSPREPEEIARRVEDFREMLTSGIACWLGHRRRSLHRQGTRYPGDAARPRAT